MTGRAAPAGVSLAARVYQELRDDILHLRLRPGQAVVEPELAQRFAVSKTPVREALGLLARDGLVLVLPHKGYVIRPVGYDDVSEIFTLRALLEPEIAAQAARRRLPHQVSGLEALLTRGRAAVDFRDEVLASLDFHHALCEIAGESRTSRIVADLAFEAHRFWMLPPGPERQITDETWALYAQIGAAVAEGDASGAAKAMSEVLDNVRRYLVEGIGRPSDR